MGRFGKSLKALVPGAAAALLCLGSSGSGAEEIRVGVVLPLSGAAARTGDLAKRTLEFAAQEFNDAGGVKSMGGAPIRLIFADHTGKPDVGMSEAERLITVEKVDLLTGAIISGVTLPTTAVAERYKTPWVVLLATADDITKRGFKYTFRPFLTGTQKAEAHARALMEIAQARGERVRSVGFIYENTEWGQSVSRTMAKLLADDGVKVVLRESYPSGTMNFTPLILKARAANPDVIVPFMYLDDSILFTKTLEELKWHPKSVFAHGGGFSETSYLRQVGKGSGEGVIVLTDFHLDLVATQQWASDLNKRFRAACGEDFTDISAITYSTFHVIADALERAGSKEKSRVRDALARTDITSGPAMLLPVSRVAFDAKGQMTEAAVAAVQIQNGEFAVVWPERFARPDMKVLWPMRGWPWPLVGRGEALSRLEVLPQVLVSGVLQGAIYGLIAVGLSVIFGVLKVINFAHGALLMVSMYAAYALWRVLGIHPYLAALVVSPAMFALGYAIQRLLINDVLRMETEREPISVLLVTLGVLYVLENVFLFVCGPDLRVVEAPLVGSSTEVGGLVVAIPRLVTLVVALAATTAIWYAMKGSAIGRAIRATGMDRETVQLMGVDPYRVYSLVFGAATALVALAGCLLVMYVYTFPSVGNSFLLRAFVCVVLGGIGSIWGAMLGGIAIALLESLASQIVTATMAEAVVFAVFLLVLYLRPRGLLGIRGER